MSDTVATPKLLIFFAWSFLGTTLGLGTAYFNYVRERPSFESTAIVAIRDLGADKSVTPESPTEPQSSSSVAAPLGSERPEGIVAEGLAILSEPVVKMAIAEKGVRDAGVANFIRRHDLQVEYIDSSPKQGQMFSIRGRGETPSAAAEVVASVVNAYRGYVSKDDGSESWQQALAQFSETHAVVNSRIEKLEQQLEALSLPADASLLNGSVVSRAATQVDSLRSEAEQVANQKSAAETKLQKVELLLAADAPDTNYQDILTTLNITQIPRSQPQPAAVESPEMKQAAAEQRAAEIEQARQQRIALTEQVQRELIPLEQELDLLLLNVGTEHPKAKGLRKQIALVRAKLTQLPPIPAPLETPPNPFDQRITPPSDPAETSEQRETLQKKITTKLAALRVEIQRLDARYKTIEIELDKAAKEFTSQQQTLQEEQRLREALSQQYLLADQITRTLAAVPDLASDHPKEVTVVRPAERGTQVAPNLGMHLAAGGGLGCLSGMMLVGLVLVTTQQDRSETIG
ncbi:hypothetical protein CA51_41710 [Rosistilla oblonga]|nr:hypothetical protein CA51_41710 [Rosistilla oblonga]